MPETEYRASRWMRVLGNPAAYRVMKVLGARTRGVTELAGELRQTRQNLSITLRHLRQTDLVRYETRGRSKVYWVKDVRVLVLMRQVERMVNRMRSKAW
jgi:DNA-binding transcriptional ArsR family regulator